MTKSNGLVWFSGLACGAMGAALVIEARPAKAVIDMESPPEIVMAQRFILVDRHNNQIGEWGPVPGENRTALQLYSFDEDGAVSVELRTPRGHALMKVVRNEGPIVAVTGRGTAEAMMGLTTGGDGQLATMGQKGNITFQVPHR